MFENPVPTADFNRGPAIPESASVDIRVAASVDFQSSESIDNKPSESDDSQSSESIDTKPSTSVDILRLSEQPKTEKSKSGGRTKNRKKKKKRNVDADFLPLVPLQCQEGSLEYGVRCRGGSEPFTKIETIFDIRYSFDLAFQWYRFEVHQHPIAEVMLVLLRSGQSVSREKAVEEMKDCRSMTQHGCRSTVMPERGPSIFQDRLKPRTTPSYQNTHGRP
ncbi:hypothetical protein F2Q69_00052675 [Brassica cretica]|uniref:Uncharacterized protein n=1 Tax=Brassica cretica TaxID=69181 RepID=A0A8S9MRK8_BRACR|nr:hypothetical protein F2Q69_00052675 [Brassica cretica]